MTLSTSTFGFLLLSFCTILLLLSSSSSSSSFTNAQTCLQSGASPITLPAFSGDWGPVPPGYYTTTNVSSSSSYVYICPPTPSCLEMRLSGEEFCGPQGSHDVAICPPGSYCPNFQTKLPCPSGSFCPTGATAPTECSPLSYCPEGAEREVFYGSLFILFFLLVIYAFAMFIAVVKVGAVPASWSEDIKTTTSSPDTISTSDPNKDKRALQMAEDGAGAAAPSASMNIAPSSSMIAKATESMKVIGNAIKRRRDVQTQSRKTGKGKLKPIKGKERLTINFSDLCVTVPVPPSEIAEAKKDAELQKERDEEMQERDAEDQEEATSTTNVVKKQQQDKSWHTYNDSGEKILLHPMSGQIESAKLTTIIAPSGSGKSVLINRFLGRKDPNWNTSGRVTTTTIFDEEIVENDTTLNNNAPYVPSAGSTAITSRPLSDEEFRDLTAMVPQEDILHYELTVHQNLFFTSETRLPVSWSQEDKETFRKAILEGLQLLPYADRTVGAPASQDEAGAGGLSGGQRKRASIATELASAPIFLALDSPTTGLDSSVAQRICELLKRLAREAEIPIVMVVDQPRIEIWEMIDDVFLLAPGGRQCYSGPAADALEFIKEYGLREVKDHGFNFEEGNPADLIIDVISLYPDEVVDAWNQYGNEFRRGLVQRKINRAQNNTNNNTNTNKNDHSPDAVIVSDENDNGEDAPTGKQHTEQALEPMEVDQLQIVKNKKEREQMEEELHREADALRQPSTKQFDTNKKDENDASNNNNNTNTVSGTTQNNNNNDQDELIVTHNPDNEKPGVLHEAWFMLARRFLKYGTEWKIFVNDIAMTIVCAAIMSASVVNITWGAPLKDQYVLLGAKFQNELVFMFGMLVCIGVAAAVGPTAIRVWGLEKNQLLREFRGGNRVSSVYIGYTIAEICRLFMLSFVFSTVAYLMWQPVMQFGSLFGVIFSIFLCQDAVGAWIGIYVPISSARLIALIGTVFMSLLNAFPDVPFIFHGFYSYYQTNLLMAAEWEPSEHVYDMASLTSKAFKAYPEDPIGQRGLAIAVILIWYFALKIGAFVHLWYLSKRNQ